MYFLAKCGQLHRALFVVRMRVLLLPESRQVVLQLELGDWLDPVREPRLLIIWGARVEDLTPIDDVVAVACGSLVVYYDHSYVYSQRSSLILIHNPFEPKFTVKIRNLFVIKSISSVIFCCPSWWTIYSICLGFNSSLSV